MKFINVMLLVLWPATWILLGSLYKRGALNLFFTIGFQVSYILMLLALTELR